MVSFVEGVLAGTVPHRATAGPLRQSGFCQGVRGSAPINVTMWVWGRQVQNVPGGAALVCGRDSLCAPLPVDPSGPR